MAVDFLVRRSRVVDRGSGAPFTPSRHSLGIKIIEVSAPPGKVCDTSKDIMAGDDAHGTLKLVRRSDY